MAITNRHHQGFISNRASIEVAKTLIHEILHAQIGHQIQTSSSSFIEAFGQYISTSKNIVYADQHQLMMDNYLQPIIGFLRNYDGQNGYSVDEKYYRGIAISGLSDFINLSQVELNEIYAAQSYFRTRGLNCQ